ncbi:glycosyltransferase family 2 protein [Spirosoma rhododendri]|uniref:Glycosyltransferase family 2 protein n=1 Tax=Spirosoma rhododendri TaxID=2728024 RepID=A0A7L5DGU7_9BACT|nr:glycosyltransferase family 2 protein [Spirosoma rhododendri]QJD77496.1 glycosyltransferase family 2 protein [Spirosoma rhododendri]
MRIAGVVVLYNSPLDCLHNIDTYIHQIEKLFVVDNSDVSNDELIATLSRIPTVSYINNGGNRGISYALNRGAEQAISEGFTHLLTMDDDSRAPATMIAEMVQYLSTQPADQVGIVGAAHSPSTIKAGVPSSVLYTMTSGNLLNLQVYKTVGPFRDDFFIDHVDHEYNLRLNKAGYKVVELPTVQLDHPLGERKQRWGKKYVSHNPVRQYYIARNGIIVARQYRRDYPAFSLKMVDLLAKEWIKILFGMNERGRRARMLVKGIKDGFAGKTGRL